MSHGAIKRRGTVHVHSAVLGTLRFDVLGGVASFHIVFCLRACGSARAYHEADIRGADAVGVFAICELLSG